MTRRHALAAPALLLMALGFAFTVGGQAAAECPIPTVPAVGCPLPGSEPTATPEATPEATPSSGATPSNPATSAPEPEEPATPAESPAAAPVFPGVQPGAPAGTDPLPSIAPNAAAVPAFSPQPVAALAPLSGIVASSFGLAAFGLLAVTLLLAFLAGLRKTSTHRPLDGALVNPTRSRLYAGLAVLAVAALIGGIGWYRLSGEPLLNRQIPFLASAGMLVVLLSVLGGSLIVAEQLRGDQERIHDLEQAVRSLTEALAPMIESPARRATVEEEPAPAKQATRRRGSRPTNP